MEKCAKNARKALVDKPTSYSNSRPNDAIKYPSERYVTPSYPEHPPAFGVQHNAMQPARTASILVKHKTTRAYDPEAVARMKEKLGLSRKREEV